VKSYDLLFGWQTFGWHNVRETQLWLVIWSTDIWAIQCFMHINMTCHLVDRHLANTTFGKKQWLVSVTQLWLFHLVDRYFINTTDRLREKWAWWAQQLVLSWPNVRRPNVFFGQKSCNLEEHPSRRQSHQCPFNSPTKDLGWYSIKFLWLSYAHS
jgi:hypothetical protein